MWLTGGSATHLGRVRVGVGVGVRVRVRVRFGVRVVTPWSVLGALV